jgi:hypothetical protein
VEGTADIEPDLFFAGPTPVRVVQELVDAFGDPRRADAPGDSGVNSPTGGIAPNAHCKAVFTELATFAADRASSTAAIVQRTPSSAVEAADSLRCGSDEHCCVSRH